MKTNNSQSRAELAIFLIALLGITIILLSSFTCNAQVYQYKANQTALTTSFEEGKISKEAYFDISKMYLDKLQDSTHIVIEKPHYNMLLDLSILGGGIVYQKFGRNVKYDYILHGWGGYFATKAMCYGLDRMGCSKLVCTIAPFLITSALCLLKEYIVDASPSKGDLYAGVGGACIASISYSIDIEKLFKK